MSTFYYKNRPIIELGGFLWWLLIRFGRTSLKKEQSEKYGARNILFICVLVMFCSFIKIKIIDPLIGC